MARYQPAERDARYRKRRRAGYPVAVSEGDSWFDYPNYLNLIDRLDDAALFAHLRLELSGDTVMGMIGSAAMRRNLRTVVEEARPIVLLFSGGGNDLADAADTMFQEPTGNSAASCLVDSAVDTLFDEMRAAYAAMIAEVGPLVPIFAHGYDYFAPSPKPVRLNGVKLSPWVGPWIHPAMVRAGITSDRMRRAVARILVDRFNDMLDDLERLNPLDFAYVDLRGTLEVDKDWQNEIHPTRKGFVAVASAFKDDLVARLPDLLKERATRTFTVAS